jgi:hypothetical protein
MTPMPDGTIVHVVGYGQTLWAIAMAYGITVDQIRAWNNIPPDSNEIYAGQRLLVLPASLVTPHPPAQTETTEPTSSDSVVVVAVVEPSITTGPTQTRTPTLEKEAQDIASPSGTSTMTAGLSQITGEGHYPGDGSVRFGSDPDRLGAE